MPHQEQKLTCPWCDWEVGVFSPTAGGHSAWTLMRDHQKLEHPDEEAEIHGREKRS